MSARLEFQGALPDDTQVWVEAAMAGEAHRTVVIVRAQLIRTDPRPIGDVRTLGVDLLPLVSPQAKAALVRQAEALFALQDAEPHGARS